MLHDSEWVISRLLHWPDSPRRSPEYCIDHVWLLFRSAQTKEKMRYSLKRLRMFWFSRGISFLQHVQTWCSGGIFVWWHQGQWGGFCDSVIGLNAWLSLRRGVQHAHVLPAKSDTWNYLADAKCVRSWSGNYHPWHWLCFSISSVF